MSDAPETFYAIRLTDGEMIYGEYEWMACDGPDDWTVADNSEHDDGPVEYEIVEMTVRSLVKRTFGDLRDLHERFHDECGYCAEPWPCEWLRENPVLAPVPPGGSA
jgi:hypothetical protein